MNTEIIAIGNPKLTAEIVGKYDFKNEDDVFVVSVPTSASRTVIAELNNEGIEAYTYNQYLKMIKTNQKLRKISMIGDIFEWVRSGYHYFYCNYSSSFELFSLDKKEVKSCLMIEDISGAYLSNNGAIYGFVKDNQVIFHTEDTLSLVFDLKVDGVVKNVEFNRNDSVVAIITDDLIVFYDIFKGQCLGSIIAQPFIFMEDGIYLREHDKTIGFNEIDGIKRCENVSESFSVVKKVRIARFENSQDLQKIIYTDSGKITSKTQTYIKNVDFIFAEKRLFALITKNINKEEQYLIESYFDGEITLNILEAGVNKVSVSDNMFVVQDSTNNVSFYVKDRYSFVLNKIVKKTGQVLLSAMGSVCVIYDTNTRLVEFYDKCVLRSAFNQDRCTHIKWSDCGLYVACYTTSDFLGCMVQIFNNNGFLMFKKIFSGLNKFEWRGFPDLLDSVKEEILANNPMEEDAKEDDVKDKSDLLAEWKGYLLLKMQSLSN